MSRNAHLVMLAAAVVALLGAGMFAQGQTGAGTPPPHQGQGPGRGMGPMPGPGMLALLGRLNLTDSQIQEIHKVMAEAQPQLQADMQQMRTLHAQLRDEVFAENGPSGKETGVAQQIADLQAKMIQAHLPVAASLSRILTPEQRAQVRQMPIEQLMGMLGGPGPMGHGGRGR